MNILDLPTDVWLYLTTFFLDPKDLLVLDQTSNSLHELISRTDLWWSHLRRVCEKDVIFLPSFDREAMNVRDYKRATLAPIRMISILHRLQSRSESSKRRLLPVYRYPLDFIANSNIFAMLLIPGGRFLVVKTKEEIAVLDLYVNGPVSSQARHQNSGSSDLTNLIFLAGPSLDSTKIRIASVEHTEERLATLIVLEFDPDTSQLRILATKSIAHGRPNSQTELHGDTMSGNVFAFFDQHSLTIYAWDFVKDVYISWTIDPDQVLNARLTKLMIDCVKNVITLVTDVVLLIWDLEPILRSNTSRSISGLAPTWVLPFILRRATAPFEPIPAYMRAWVTFFSLNTWYYTHLTNQGFDFLLWNDTAHDLVGGHAFTYELTLPPQPISTTWSEAIQASSDYLNATLTLSQIHDLHNLPVMDTGIKHNRLCDGEQVLLWEGYRQGLYTYAKPSQVDDEPPTSPARTRSLIPSDGLPSHPGETYPVIRQDVLSVEIVRFAGMDREDLYPVWGPHQTADTRPQPIFGAPSFDPTSGLLASTTVDGRSIIMHDYIGTFGGNITRRRSALRRAAGSVGRLVRRWTG